MNLCACACAVHASSIQNTAMDAKINLCLIFALINCVMATTASPSATPLLCYWRDGKLCGVEHIDPFLCTHIIYAFVDLTTDNSIAINSTKPLQRLNDIKKLNPKLKVMVAIGGGLAPSRRFSDMVVVHFLRTNSVDGLDVDWEFPGHHDGPNRENDKENFALLLRELRVEFDKSGWVLSVPVAKFVIAGGYDVPVMTSTLDFISMMCYDVHGWDWSKCHNQSCTGVNGPAGDVDGSIEQSVTAFLDAGATRDKLVVGMPTYGRSWTLAHKELYTDVGAPASGPGEKYGARSYRALCQDLRTLDGWTTNWDEPSQTPYAFRDSYWISYDDARSVEGKSWYIVEQGLGGAMFWTVDMDDCTGRCGDGPFPLIAKSKSIIQHTIPDLPSTFC